MEKKLSLILDKEFIEYCRINNIEDVEKFAKETFNKGFMLLKYGNTSLLKEGTHYQTIKVDTNKLLKEPEDLKRMREKVETTTLAEEINKKNNLYDE